MDCKIYPPESRESYRFVVIFSRFQGKLLLSRHRQRSTWETQGGHIEPGETPLDAAKRELFEESGAAEFSICPIFDYWAEDNVGSSNGMVFVAEIEKLGLLPDSEMAETALFDTLPENVTYPFITPVLFEELRKQKLW